MAHPKYTIQNAAAMGVIAGVIVGLVATVSASLVGRSPALPLRMVASLLIGEEALDTTPLLGVFVAGSGVHLILSAFFGAIYGAILATSSKETRTSFARESLFGLLFGLGVWVLGFLVLSPFAWPWLLSAPLAFVALILAVFYGLPLALLLAYRERHVVPADDVYA